MLDLDRILANPDELKRMLVARMREPDEVDALLNRNELRRQLMKAVAKKKALRKTHSNQINQAMASDASNEEIPLIKDAVHNLDTEIAAMDIDIAQLHDKIQAFLLSQPNYPHPTVPVGKDERNDMEIFRWGKPREFPWQPKPHWMIGTDLNILDFDTDACVQKSSFTVYRNLGAQLERAIVNFTLDAHIRAGYHEIRIPYVGRQDPVIAASSPTEPSYRQSLYAEDPFLIPTAEVSVINLYRETDLNEDQLPIRHCAISAEFMADSVNAGLNTRGMLHQRVYNKIALVDLCKPESSYDELERMTEQAQKNLRLLNLPYRLILPCTGSLDFCASKSYALQVWMPSCERYVEVSRFSNCEDFQARRAGIRYHSSLQADPLFCHTLSGISITVGHTVAAILENNQNEDGSVSVPEVLRPYMHTHIIR